MSWEKFPNNVSRKKIIGNMYALLGDTFLGRGLATGTRMKWKPVSWVSEQSGGACTRNINHGGVVA